MKKFKTPVAMKVTQEQYERDLKEPLESIGYSMAKNLHRLDSDCPWIITQNCGDNDECGANQSPFNRIIVNHYNPELFLALASMTEGDKPIAGEWMICIEGIKDASDGHDFIEGNLFKVKKETEFSYEIGSDTHPDAGFMVNGWLNYTNHFRKATTEELIAHLSKDFVLPEKWYCPYANRKEFDIMNDYFGAGWIYVEPNGTSGCTNKEGCNHWIHKGHKDLINYTEITFEQFKTHVLKNNKAMKDSRFPFTLQTEDAKRIVKIACGDWKEKLVKDKNWGMNIAQDASISISEKFYTQMRKACDDKQNKLFDDIFGKDIKEEVYSIGDRFNRRNLEETQVMLCKTPDYKCVFIMLDGNARGTYYGRGNTIELKSKFTKEDLSQLLHGDFDDMLTKID